MKRGTIAEVLAKTFKQAYIPILSEFGFNMSGGFDFEKEVDTLVQPLLEDDMLTKKGDVYMITKKGRGHLESTLKGMRYHQIV